MNVPKATDYLAAFIAIALAQFMVAGCADLSLLRYRDDRLLNDYRYALGESYLDVDGIRLCYQEAGHGAPVLILPGLGTTIDFWRTAIPGLADRFHVIALDPPGFGKSAKPDASYELPWMCNRVLAFLDAKGLRRVSVIGGSMGGHLGLMLALDHPDRVDKLVMMGSTGAWPPPSLLLDTGLTLFWREALVINYMRTNWPRIFSLMFHRGADFTPELLRYQMASRASAIHFEGEGRAAARALKSIFYNSRRAQLSHVTQPVLLIWGELDEIHPPEDAFFMRRRIPDSRLLIVPDSGHEVMVDQPEVFREQVSAFLERGTSGVDDRFVQR